MRRKKNSIPKLHVKKGDNVMVVSGNDKGKTGSILDVFPKDRRVMIEGVNVRAHHTKPTAQNPEGGINKKEVPVHISNVMLVDPKTGEPTRVGRKEEGGKLLRYAKKSGEIID